MSEIPLFKNVENDGLDCRLFGYICDLEERGGFYDASEVYLAKLAQGFAQVELPVTKMHLNWQGKVQDGVYATEAAAAANFAFHTLDKIGVISSLSLHIKGQARNGTVLLCEARALEISQSRIAPGVYEETYVIEIKITDQNNKLLAEGQAEMQEKSDFLYTYAEYLRSIGYAND